MLIPIDSGKKKLTDKILAGTLASPTKRKVDDFLWEHSRNNKYTIYRYSSLSFTEKRMIFILIFSCQSQLVTEL